MDKKKKIILSIIIVVVLAAACVGIFFPRTKADTAPTAPITIIENPDDLNMVDKKEKGGSIFIGENEIYTMTGGEIRNTFNTYGGAVYVSNGATFIMEGGTISNCEALYGGAIFVEAGGKCFINGGTIESNKAEYSPAIFVEEGGELLINGATQAVGLGASFEIAAEDVSITNNRYADYGLTVNVYVGDELRAIVKQPTRAIKIANMPYAYEDCCGYYFDEELTISAEDCDKVAVPTSVNLFEKSNLPKATNGEINVYTKLATKDVLSFGLISAQEGVYVRGASDSLGGREEVVLPREYVITKDGVSTTYPVTSIYRYGFDYSPNVKRFVLSNAIKKIDRVAFYNCSNLETINIPDSVKSIGDNTFTTCYNLKNIYFGEGITFIDKEAFLNCNKLERVKFPNSLTSIGGRLFVGCSNLKTVEFGSNLKTITENTFNGCANLTTVELPEKLESIGNSAFYNCSKLKNLTFPNTLKKISNNAFYGCRAFSDIVIPNSVKTLEAAAFQHCSGLTNIKLSNNITIIDRNLFNGCSNLTSITIPSNVKEIKDEAFRKCTSLKDVNLNEGLAIIYNHAFAECSGLKYIELPDNMSVLEGYAFYLCPNLTKIYLPKSTQFASSYTSITIYSDLQVGETRPDGWLFSIYTSIGRGYTREKFRKLGYSNYTDFEFDGTVLTKYNGTSDNVVIPGFVTEIGDSAFADCYGLQSIEIPNSVTSIGDSAFSGCSGLISLTIPNGVTSIGDSAFDDCHALTSVTIPNSVTSIGDWAFYYCLCLSSIEIPNSVTSIGDGVFAYCYALTSVTIPNSVTSISDYAFSSCLGLESLEIPNSVKTIGDYAFADCHALTSVTIPNSVTRIGGSAFSGCYGLTNVFIPRTVTSMGPGIFSNCHQVSICTNASEDMPLWDSLWNSDDDPGIDYSVNYNCLEHSANIYQVSNESNFTWDGTVLTGYTGNSETVFVPYFITEIGDNAFSGCTSIKHVGLPKGLEIIGDNAFSGCTNLESVILPGRTETVDLLTGKTTVHAYGVNTIGKEAFADCANLNSVYIPSSVETIGQGVFRAANSNLVIYTGVIDAKDGWYDAVSSLAWNNNGADWLTVMYHCGVKSNGEIVNNDFVFDGTELVKYVGSSANVNIPSFATKINAGAFKNNENITSVTIPNGVTTIGEQAFYNCVALESVYMGTGVITIGAHSFQNCSSLSSITIQNDVKTIGPQAFYNCSKLSKVNVSNLNNWARISFGDAHSNPLYYAKKLYLNNNLVTELIIDNASTIKANAFYNCTSLTSVNITSSSLTTIGGGAFCGCSALKSVTVPDSVIQIGTAAFNGCSSLNRVNISDVDAWAQINFANFSANPLHSAKSLYLNDILVTDLTIDSASKISNNAFYNCTSLVSVNIISPNLTSSGENAFYGCSNLNKVNISNISDWLKIDFDYIYANPLYLAGKLYLNNEEVTILDLTTIENLETIYSCAFSGCTSILTVTIPSSVKSVGVYAFLDSSSLNRVNISDMSAWAEIDFGNNTANPICQTKNFYLNNEKVTTANLSGSSKVGSWAFYNYSPLTSVTITDSATSIGVDAFYGCSGLTTVTMPNTITSVGDSAFYNCAGLTSVEISNGLTSIGKSVFKGCSQLESVTIPNGVTSIGESAFESCYALENVTMPETIASIGNAAFGSCSSLSELCISDIDKWVQIEFADSSSNPLSNANCCLFVNGNLVTEAVLTAESVNSYAFYQYKGLNSVSFGGAETTINQNAFTGCTRLIQVKFNETSVTINSRAFQGCTGLTFIFIPSSVTDIKNYAFYSCLRSLIIFTDIADENSQPVGWQSKWNYYSDSNYLTVNYNGVVTEDGFAYNGTTLVGYYGNASSVTVPDFITTIPQGAFKNKTGLTSVTIPSGVTSINSQAFVGCDNLQTIIVDGENTVYDSRSGCNAVIETSSNQLVLGCVGTIIPDSVTSIGDYAFYRCDGLTSITIPYSVTSIGESAFASCNELEKVTMSNGLISIGKSAFAGCWRLHGISIPNSVTSIGTGAFDYSGLQEIYLPGSASTDGQVFHGCAGLTIYTDADQSHSSWLDGYDGFDNYGYYSYWFTFKYGYKFVGTQFQQYTGTDTQITLPAFTTNIATNAFKGNTSITKVTIPEGVQTIYSFSFEDCSNLESVTLPSSLTTISSCAFTNCAKLTSITIPSKVTQIGASAFSGCLKLETVIIESNKISSVGSNAFRNCLNLKKVFIKNINAWAMINFSDAYANPLCYGATLYVEGSAVTYITLDSVATIGTYAFYNFTALNSVKFGNYVSNIGSYAFYGCTGLTSIYIPSSVQVIKEYAFYGCDRNLKLYTNATSKLSDWKQNWNAERVDSGSVYYYDVTYNYSWERYQSEVLGYTIAFTQKSVVLSQTIEQMDIVIPNKNDSYKI